MKIYLSGQDGVRRNVPETVDEGAAVMLSYYTAVVLNRNKPTGRLKAVINSRKKSKKGTKNADR